MNRKEFFKKLGIGVVAMIVAPKVIIETTKPQLKTCGIIPYLSKEGMRMSFYSNGELKAGDIVTTGTEQGIVRQENGYLISDLYPILDEQHFFLYFPNNSNGM